MICNKSRMRNNPAIISIIFLIIIQVIAPSSADPYSEYDKYNAIFNLSISAVGEESQFHKGDNVSVRFELTNLGYKINEFRIPFDKNEHTSLSKVRQDLFSLPNDKVYKKDTDKSGMTNFICGDFSVFVNPPSNKTEYLLEIRENGDFYFECKPLNSNERIIFGYNTTISQNAISGTRNCSLINLGQIYIYDLSKNIKYVDINIDPVTIADEPEPVGPEPVGPDEPMGPEPVGSDEPVGPEPVGSDEPVGPEPVGSDEPVDEPVGPIEYVIISLITIYLTIIALLELSTGSFFGLSQNHIVSQILNFLMGSHLNAIKSLVKIIFGEELIEESRIQNLALGSIVLLLIISAILLSMGIKTAYHQSLLFVISLTIAILLVKCLDEKKEDKSYIEKTLKNKVQIGIWIIIITITFNHRIEYILNLDIMKILSAVAGIIILFCLTVYIISKSDRPNAEDSILYFISGLILSIFVYVGPVLSDGKTNLAPNYIDIMLVYIVIQSITIFIILISPSMPEVIGQIWNKYLVKFIGLLKVIKEFL